MASASSNIGRAKEAPAYSSSLDRKVMAGNLLTPMGTPVAAAKPARQLPVISPAGGRKPQRPISFVTVHYSGDIEHNLFASECVADSFNELIVVDNRENLFFPTLGQALLHGMDQARNELVA